MAREQQKDLAEKFVQAQGKWDTSALESTLASDAKHDLLPASLGVSQKDNAGKIEVTKKMGSALGDKAVNIKILQNIQDVEQRKACLFLEKEYDFGAVQSFLVLNFNESNDKITHTVEFVNAEAQKKLMAKMQ
ncbi:hypothetical protein LTR56_006825 [Elasticomyces elasticus]|uniref:Uncharacterized protein n=1 Tax=Elasticomyces elasticus TaxID=574655 RepID=A0AAN7WEH1_9PEZI|nr:hypothetical protein LTR56_020884 [Elasticomyces elasticus]KAK3649642.1 hypothetical protein LTR56_006825 [Elasticomyces elasticus]KAK3654283.1 hypothetical protein LTR22_010759 [Elasticomyces elasticus]KAK3659511.1 hypothetical protein LTR22_008428 [Elasticomyces elasticus]KAK4896205.1 hypothetical protein LTR27_005726 [Elasticomyces elasticus]